jgi:hypothetical protein
MKQRTKWSKNEKWDFNVHLCIVSKRGSDDTVQSIGGGSGLDRINECERKKYFWFEWSELHLCH